MNNFSCGNVVKSLFPLITSKIICSLCLKSNTYIVPQCQVTECGRLLGEGQHRGPDFSDGPSECLSEMFAQRDGCLEQHLCQK